MIAKELMKRGSRVKVTFTLPAGRPPRFAVAGDFNHWDPTATPLRKRGETSSASITLTAGRRYAFRYVDEDGDWFKDDQAEAFENNGLGGTNCIIDLTRGGLSAADPRAFSLGGSSPVAATMDDHRSL